MNATSHAQNLHTALRSVLPPDDPRVMSLAAAIATKDESVAAAALEYVARNTTSETSAMVGLKAGLLAELRELSPCFAVVIDVPAVPEANRTTGDVYADVRRTVVARNVYALTPTTTPDGSPLAFHIVAPNGVSPGLLEAAARALHGLIPALAASRDTDRAAALAAVPVPATKKGQV